jgi:hypothetical protein
MITLRRIGGLAAISVTALIGIIVLTVQPASAALTNCTFGIDRSCNFVSATCTETTATSWDVQVECDRPNGKVVIIKGSIEFGPGTATSVAMCPVGTEIGQDTVVEL